jgi:O-antigen/teichoic acid export membrane protein
MPRHTYRDLLRHSSVYAVGQLLGRLASLVLLPIYTRYLSPADYASIAILDVTTGVLAVLIGSGFSAALTRYHFDDDREEYRRGLWWTGVAFVTATATVILLPAWFFRNTIANLLLGPEVQNRALYLEIALPQLWTGTIGQIPETHLRTRKHSTVYVVLNLGRLLLNVTLNLVFLIRLGMGVTGILLGNLITSIVYTGVQIALFSITVGAPRFNRSLVAPLWEYGRPLIATALLATFLHNGDRYILRLFVDMKAIGLYSVAYMAGQGINTMLLVPFTAIWNVAIYEIAAGTNPESTFAAVFHYFFRFLILAMFGASLMAGPLLGILAGPDYQPAADLVPIVCLAYVFFSLHEHFRVPVLLAKRTSLLLPVFGFATLLNIGANLALIPFCGIAGAAWASVITFAGFSFFGLSRYRATARYPYRLQTCCVELFTMSLCYLAFRLWRANFQAELIRQIFVAAFLWLSWALVLFRRPIETFVREQVAQKRAAVA